MYVTSITNHEDLYRLGGFLGGLTRWIAGGPDTRMSRPFAIALHPKGLLVTDPGLATVHFYNWKNRRYEALGSDLEDGLPSPVGVAVLPDGDILVSDSRLGTIERFTPSGKHRATFCGPEAFGRPAGIAVDAEAGRVCVADVTNHCIRILDLNGRLIDTVGERGDGPGQFNFPTHLALASDGGLAVTDSMNFRIQVLEPDGTIVRTFGSLGDSPGKFSKPKGIAVDAEGTVVVVEGLHDAVQFFDSDGRLLLNVGTPGSDPGQFWLPAGLAMDRVNRLLFVADSYNSRVQVFRMLEEPASGLLSQNPEETTEGQASP